jgi:hypothetical protein
MDNDVKPDESVCTRCRSAWRSLSLRARVVIAGCVLLAVSHFTAKLVEIPWRSALRGSDATFNYVWLRSLMVGGDFDFRDDLTVTNTLTAGERKTVPALPVTKTGRLANKYGIGWAVVSLPFYLVADGIVATGRALGVWTLERDGYNWVYQVVLMTGHFLLAGCSLLLAYRIVRRWCERESAVLGVAMLWAASPLVYYQASDLAMSHGVTFLAVVLCAYGVVKTKEEPEKLWPWVLAGAGLGLAVITRFQTAIYGVLPAWAWLCLAKDGTGFARLMRTAAATAAGAMPVIALQLGAWKIVYGSWLVQSYAEQGERFYWFNPALREVLFSANHGLFYWHPFLLAGFAGLVALAWRRGGLAWAGLAVAVITIYVNAAWWCWWFGSSYGSRAFDGALLFLMLGLAWAFQRLPQKAAAWLFAAGFGCALWNAVLIVLYRTSVISRNSAVTYEEMLRTIWRVFAHSSG